MNVVSECPLRVASVLWQRSTGEAALTVLCKATFVLEPGTAALAPRQDDPCEDDSHWDDDPARSLSAASDLAPFKARPEVVLVGHAFAPQQQPVRSLFVRMIVGAVDKSIEVHADRTWTPSGELREGPRFAKMRLRYERAAATPGNPVGMRFDATDTRGAVALPNLQPPGQFVGSPADRFDATGFGPIAPSWPARRERLHRHAATWSDHGWTARPLPDDFNPGYFNVAPPDQHLEVLRADERLTLEGLHPEHARLTTSLPGVQPRATLERPGRAPEELRLRADTLWIDTDRGVCSVVWRGAVPLAHAGEAGRVVVTMEGGVAGADIEEIEAEPDAGTGTLFGVMGAAGVAALPFSQVGDAAPAPRGLVADAALPFGQGAGRAGAGVPAPAPMPISDEAGATIFLAPAAPLGGGVGVAPLGPPPGPPPPVMAVVVAPPPMVVGAPVVEGSAWAPAEATPERVSIGQRMLSEVKPADGGSGGERRRDGAPERIGPIAPAVVPGRSPWGGESVPSTEAIVASVEAASNAAAARDARPAQVGEAARAASPAKVPPHDSLQAGEIVELLWFDPKVPARVRTRWPELILELAFEPLDPAHDLPTENPDDARDRHDVFGVLTDGEAIAGSGIATAVREAVSSKGRFTPPLVLVAGELKFPFDELETLKAVVAVVSPTGASDKRLKEWLDAAAEVLATPYLQGSTSAVEKLTRELKEQAAQVSKALTVANIEAYVERILLEQRRYQFKKVFGEECIRALLVPATTRESAVPVYLPKRLENALPMYASMRVRLIAEAHMRQDQYEGCAHALRGTAVGRAISR